MEAISKYFPNLPSTQLEKFYVFEQLMREWNSKINLISRKDIDNFYINHVLHSLSIAKYVSFNSGTKILDVGTGGGLPGIPLAIYFPEVEFHLIDSIRKKINVVSNIKEELKLDNVKTSWIRADKVSEKYDFVVSRAVTSIPEMHDWIGSKIEKKQNNSVHNGIILLKGGDLTEEIKNFKKSVVVNLTDYYEEYFFKTKRLVHLKS
jgi:16S rRNA (guanine527-N7)-methyltransferase